MVMEMSKTATATTVTVDGRGLKAALAYLAPAVPRKPSVPVMAGVLIESDGFNATLSAHDLTTEHRSQVLSSSGTPFRALMPHGALTALIKAATTGLGRNDRPLITLTVYGTTVEIHTGRSTAALPTLPVDDYPEFGGTFGHRSALVNTAALAKAAALVSPSVGVDWTLPLMMHVLMRGDGDGVRLTATNRYVMADARAAGTAPAGLEWLVPGKALAHASKEMAKDRPGGLVCVTADDAAGLLRFECGALSLTVRLYGDATYPPVDGLWPPVASAADVRQLNVADVVGAVKRVAAGHPKNAPVRLTFDASENLRVECSSEDTTTREVVKVGHGRMAGDQSMTVAFNAGYLIDCLSTLGTPTVTAHLVEPVKPVTFTAADGAARTLIMPIRIAR